MRGNEFPFAAMEGLDSPKRAMLLALTNPRCGGLLISGARGTGKSVLVRGAAEIAGRPWEEAPLSVTEDRLFGAMDAEAAIRTGARKLLPGLLQEADRGVLYIDDVNLLRQELLASILSTEEEGGFPLERDGFSLFIPTDFVVLAVMDPEEGTLPSSTLDRFGLFAEAETATEVESRCAIIRKALAFEENGTAFRNEWREETEKLKEELKSARRILPEVSISEAMRKLAAAYALRAYCAGHRADIFLIETARAAAALDGRRYVLPKDLKEAALFVLPHRMGKTPQETGEAPEDMPNENENPLRKPLRQESDDTQPKEEKTENWPAGEDSPRDESDHENENDKTEPEERPQNGKERVDSADTRVKLPPMRVDWDKDRKKRRGSGKRNLTRTDSKQGRYVRAEPAKGKAVDIAFDATLRAAAPYQEKRRAIEKSELSVILRREDLRGKVREKRTGQVFLFCVDASGSMGARERMRMVKGVILKMLLEAYQKRDCVGMIAFRRTTAELLLPVTRSVDLAEKCLASLPTGGKTPLAAGLELAEKTMETLLRQDSSAEPALVILTDGRATAPLSAGGDAATDAVAVAKRLAEKKFPMAVIDTESGFVRFGIAEKIAREMGAAYYPADRLTEERLLRIAKKVKGR